MCLNRFIRSGIYQSIIWNRWQDQVKTHVLSTVSQTVVVVMIQLRGEKIFHHFRSHKSFWCNFLLDHWIIYVTQIVNPVIQEKVNIKKTSGTFIWCISMGFWHSFLCTGVLKHTRTPNPHISKVPLQLVSCNFCTFEKEKMLTLRAISRQFYSYCCFIVFYCCVVLFMSLFIADKSSSNQDDSSEPESSPASKKDRKDWITCMYHKP